MSWSNFHTHSNFCDGKSAMSDSIAKAKELGLVNLGFSSHAPLPFSNPWCMKADVLPKYLKTIKQFKEQSDSINIYSGLEVDYIPGKIGPSDFQSQLDYTIGSVHFVDSFSNGDGWEVDGTLQVFKAGLLEVFDNDIRKAVSRYFEITRQMLETSTPTILGHMDRIKVNNQGNLFFNENEKWYEDEIIHTLEIASKHNVIIEVNTRGLYMGRTTTTYPGIFALRAIKEKNIRVMLASDAHHEKDLIAFFPETVKLLRSMQFQTISVLNNSTWDEVELMRLDK